MSCQDGWSESSQGRVPALLEDEFVAVWDNFFTKNGYYSKPWYIQLLNAKKPDYLKEGLLKFLQQGPKDLDQCVLEGGKLMKSMGFKGSPTSDDFRMRVFEKLHQLKAVGYVTTDRSVKPPLFAAA